MKCDQCQQNEAIIHVNESGDFCLACHNQIMAKQLGSATCVDPGEQVITLKDPQGRDHSFIISLLRLPICAIWRAWESGGGYEFETRSKPEDNQAIAYQQLIEKLVKGLTKQSLVRYTGKQSYSNAIELKDGQYGLNSVGTGRIILDPQSEDLAALVIDGKEVPIEAFGRALTCYEGATLDFQIRDRSEAVLAEGMILKPVSIDPEQIYQRFDQILSWFLERGSISYKRVNACGDALIESLNDLNLLVRYGDRETARQLAQRMKKRLAEIDCDDDHFLEYHLELINTALIR